MQNTIDISINLHLQKIVIILNTKINRKLVELISSGESFIICADGGSNRLFQTQSQLIPNIIIGDFDSIEETTKNYYKEKGVQVVQDKNQDTTDMEKALNFAMKVNPFSRFSLFIYGGFGGRLDHTLANISNFIKFHDLLKENNEIDQLIHFGESSILQFLKPGSYLHRINRSIQTFNGVGLFPINGVASVESKGLKWNLEYSCQLTFGQFISSSNEFTDETIEIRNKDSIIFVTCLQNEFQEYK